ncbi:organic cation/carnitine transporter 7-like isoform X2 [Carex rostrata]
MGDEAYTYTVDEALLSLGFGKFQTLVLAYAGISWLSEAMEIMLLSFVGPSVRTEWGISDKQESLISSVVFAGMMIGAFTWGYVSDNYGRRQGRLPSPFVSYLLHLDGLPFHCINYKLGWLWKCHCTKLHLPSSPPIYCWCRIGRGTCAGHLVLRVCSFSQPGHLDDYFYIFLDCGNDSSSSCCVGSHSLQEDHASSSNVNLSESSPLLGTKTRNGLKVFLTLLSPKLVRSTLLLWLVFFGNAFGYYGVVLLASELSGRSSKCNSNLTRPSHLKDDASLYRDVFLTSVAEVPGLLLAALAVDKVGRKASMYVMLFTCCAFLAPLVWPQKEVVTTALLFGARACVTGSFNIVYIYTPEVYPTSVRSTGLGVASAMGRIGGMLCPIVAVSLVENCQQTEAILLFDLVIFVAGVATTLFSLETKGRDLIA